MRINKQLFKRFDERTRSAVSAVFILDLYFFRGFFYAAINTVWLSLWQRNVT